MTSNRPHLTQTDIDWSKAKEIFADLIEVPYPDRGEMLQRKIGHDERLRHVVTRLLSAHGNAAEFLDDTGGV